MRRFLVPVLLAVLVAGCSRPAPPPVVVISVDTLRSDRLPAYGYRKIETPALDRLAQDGVVYERAFSHVPLTLPSHATLFTGLLPTENGVRNNRGYELGADHATLAERFHAAGYRTAGFVSSFVLAKATGIARGFDTWDDDMGAGAEADPEGTNPPRRAGDETLKRAEAWLDALAAEKTPPPPFLFFHVYEPHAPYVPQERWRAKYPDVYDALVAQADDVVGRLLESLRRRGLYDRALVVFLSDHGEGLLDHGEQQHGLTLYREALQVPLIVKRPHGATGAAAGAAAGSAAAAGTREARVTGLSDVFAMIVSGAAIDAGKPVPARAGAGAGASDRPVYSETLAPQEGYGLAPLRSLVDWPRHFIAAPRSELFDLARDPAEKDDRLKGAAPPRDMVAALDRVGQGRFAEAAVSSEDQERLASLGYVGGARTTPGTGRDVKDVLPRIEELWRQLEALNAPETKGNEHGSPVDDRALLALLDEVAPGNETLRRTTARRLLRAQRLDAARRVAATLVNAQAASSWSVIGEIALASGKPQDARAAFDRALSKDAHDARATLGLGMLDLGAGRLDDAERRLRAALDADKTLADAWNGLGVIAAQKNDLKGAITAWEKAVALEPRLSDAWFNLALAREQAGDAHGAAEARRRVRAVKAP